MGRTKDNKFKIQTVIEREDVKCSANVEENYIFTTEDKIKILYEDYNAARKSSGDFWTCFSIFLTLVITLFTCDCKSFSFINEATIRAMFIISTFVSFVLCVYFATGWFRNRKKLKFSYFIARIKGVHTIE